MSVSSVVRLVELKLPTEEKEANGISKTLSSIKPPDNHLGQADVTNSAREHQKAYRSGRGIRAPESTDVVQPGILTSGDVEGHTFSEEDNNSFSSQQYTDMLQRIYKAMDSAWASKRTKVLMTEYVICVSKGVLPSIFSSKLDENFSPMYEEDNVAYFIELLVRLETGEVLGKNVLRLLTWLDATSARLRILSMAALLAIVQKHPKIIREIDGFIESFESKLYSVLTNVPLVSIEQSNQSFGGLLGRLGYGLLKSVEPSLLEPSGYPARNFFTVLNTLPSDGHMYQTSHLVHVAFFSMVYPWLLGLHHPAHDNTKLSNLLPLRISTSIETEIVRYCTRLLDQIAMPKATTYMEGVDVNDPRLQDDLHEAITAEALKLLDLLCQRNASIVTRIFPIVKRFAIDKFNAHIRRTNSRHSPVAFLAAMQFFINHNEVTTMFDVDPIFRSFFHDYLRRYYRNNLLAFETLRFCIFNKRKLLTHTNMLSLYFPALLKLVAWHPRSFLKEFTELLPALVSPSSCMELFHSILDLPFLASVMESSFENPFALVREQSINFNTTGPQKQFENIRAEQSSAGLSPANIRLGNRQREKELHGNNNVQDRNDAQFSNSISKLSQVDMNAGHRNFSVNRNRKDDQLTRLGSTGDGGVDYVDQLISYLLRDESLSYGSSGPQTLHRQTAFDTLSGMEGCIWGTPEIQDAAHKLCHKSNVTIRVHEVCLLVPQLLNVYFDVMLVDAPEECVCAMVRVIFSRFGMLYGPIAFRGRVRRVLLDRLLAAFEKFSHFLVPLKHNMVHAVTNVDSDSNCSELGLHCCWLIGKYASANKVQVAVITDLFEALETIVYERLFIISGSGNPVSTEDEIRSPRIAANDSVQLEAAQSAIETTTAHVGNQYPTRLMHVLISTLAKLGACISDLAPRAQLCLAKVLSTSTGFHYSVRNRAKELVRLLKLSSVASKIFDMNNTGESEIKNQHGQRLKSSLTFLLRPSGTFKAGIKLHNFSL